MRTLAQVHRALTGRYHLTPACLGVRNEAGPGYATLEEALAAAAVEGYTHVRLEDGTRRRVARQTAGLPQPLRAA